MSKEEVSFPVSLGDVDDGKVLESSTPGFLVGDDEHVPEDLRVGLEVDSLESEGPAVARPDNDVRVLVVEVSVEAVLSRTIGWRCLVVGGRMGASSRRHRRGRDEGGRQGRGEGRRW